EQTKEEIKDHIIQYLHNALDNLGFKNPEKMERILSENSGSAKTPFFENKCNTTNKIGGSADTELLCLNGNQAGLKYFAEPNKNTIAEPIQ
ncbi:MAG: hypothetical protein ABJF26_05305, partial [Lentilitoribacter sp.]